MKFTHEYTKLSKDEFTTIRRDTGFYYTGKTISIITPKQEFSAQIIDAKSILKREISDDLAQSDADMARDNLIKQLESWYGKDYDMFVLLKLKRLR